MLCHHYNTFEANHKVENSQLILESLIIRFLKRVKIIFKIEALFADYLAKVNDIIFAIGYCNVHQLT